MQFFRSLFQNLKVGTKLSVSIIVIVLAIMAGTFSVIISSYRSNLIANSEKLMTSELEAINQNFESQVQAIGELTKSVAIAQEKGLFGNREASFATLSPLLDVNPNLYGISINYRINGDGQDADYLHQPENGKDGRFVPYILWKDPVRHEAKDHKFSYQFNVPWWLMPKEKAEAYLSGKKNIDLLSVTPPYFTRNVPIVSVVYPIIIEEKFEGVISLDLALNGIQDRLKKLKPYQTTSNFLLSSSGQILAGDLFGKGMLSKSVNASKYADPGLLEVIKEKKEGIYVGKNATGEKDIYYVLSMVKSTGMIMGMAVDKDEIVGPISRLITIISAGIFVAILASFFMVFFLSNRLVVKPVSNIMELFSEIGMGNFDARAEIMSSDELGQMAESLNAMLDNTLSLIQSREERDAIQDSIMKLLHEISGLTEGDMTVRAEVTEDITGAIADSFNLMAEQLGRVVLDVKLAAESVTDTSGEVHDSTNQLAQNAMAQAQQIEEAIDRVNRMAESIRGIAARAEQSAKVSEQSTLSAKEGAEAVSKTNASMADIRENVQETARAIKRLGESSQEIGNIVQIIEDIADRTSILALNASIQAAMAGEAGRGFAVVAEEVQRLAERSTSSTKQIDSLVRNIQGEISEAGASMEASIQQVVEGSKLAEAAYTKLEDIQNVSTELAGIIDTITETSEAQATASSRITESMKKIGEVSNHTSNASQETTNRMTELEKTAGTMMDSISTFKVG